MSKELREQFEKEVHIDLTDHETVGKFPYFNNGKWSSVARGDGWQRYSKWLESKLKEVKITVAEAEIIAVGISEHLDAQEQSFFIAGFQECIKYLNEQKSNRIMSEKDLIKSFRKLKVKVKGKEFMQVDEKNMMDISARECAKIAHAYADEQLKKNLPSCDEIVKLVNDNSKVTTDRDAIFVSGMYKGAKLLKQQILKP